MTEFDSQGLPLITKKHIRTIGNIARRVSASSGVDYEELYGEGIDKLDRIRNNFRPELGKPFDAYLAICIRGHCLNYLRDKSFLSSVKRSYLYLYNHSRKFKTLQQASDALVVPLELLQQIHIQVKNSRRYNVIDISNEWMVSLPDEDFSSEARLLLVELLDTQEYNLLEDFYINNENEGDLIDKYGEDYSDQVDLLVNRLAPYKEQLLEWLG